MLNKKQIIILNNKALYIVLILTLIKLALFVIINSFIQLKGRNIISYVDLDTYLKQGEMISKNGIISTLSQMQYVNNLLWSYMIYSLVNIFRNYKNLMFLAIIISSLRDYLWLKIYLNETKKDSVIKLMFLLASPYLFIYSFNFSSDLLGSLAIILAILPIYYNDLWTIRKKIVSNGLILISLTLFLYVRINFLFITIFYGLQYLVLLKKNWGKINKNIRYWGITTTVVSLILGVLIGLISLKLYIVFSKSSNYFGPFSFSNIHNNIANLFNTDWIVTGLSYLSTSIVHCFTFFFVRESIYLNGFNSVYDFILTFYLIILHLPGIIWLFYKKKIKEITVITLLFIPSMINFSHARYSLPLQCLIILNSSDFFIYFYNKIQKKLIK